MTDLKAAALRFQQLILAGEIDEAYDTFIDMSGKHHNAYFAAGFPALRQAMKENHGQFPHKKMTVIQAIAEGDRVAVHSHIVLQDGEPGFAAVHVFRFEGGKIVEMWDNVQILQADSPNADGAF